MLELSITFEEFQLVLLQAWEAAAPARFLLTCIFHELKKNSGKVKNSTKFKTS